MQYTRLTKEQFEELQQEFINFLASQTITAKEWETLKKEKPEVAESELDVFSDLIWEGVLSNTSYLEHYFSNQLYLFEFQEQKIKLISIKINDSSVDLTKTEGLNWLTGHLSHHTVDIFKASKAYSKNRNSDIFALVQQGAVISKGELYKSISQQIGN
ncbi:MAG: hypothetical protein JKZ03_01425 [Flavobacteriaceae bacterium]|nr:hypothetical protein [Flavobacteriaceae bacterium]